MAISYVGFGAVSALTAAATPAYPAGIAASDLLILTLISDAGSAAIPAQTGWTLLGAGTDGGGLGGKVFTKTAAGTETGSYTTTGTVTGGTKGAAVIEAYRPGSGTATAAAAYGTDVDTSSTAFSASGSSSTSATGAMWASVWCALAPSGSYTASASASAIAQAGATVTSTGSFGGRTGTNTLTYGGLRGAVTAGGTGAPTTTATTVGANAAGVAMMVLVSEAAAPSSPQAVTAVSGGTQYGAAASHVAGLNDADDTTGTSLAVGESVVYAFGGALAVAGGEVTGCDLRLTGPASYTAGLWYDSAATSRAAADQSTTLAGAGPTTWRYQVTAGEEAALTTRTGLAVRVTRTA